jgi:hypothetical protein
MENFDLKKYLAEGRLKETFVKLSDEQKAKVMTAAKRGEAPEDVVDSDFDGDDRYLQSVKALMDRTKLHEEMSSQDVVDIAGLIADEFTKEDAEGDRFSTYMIYKVGDVDGMSFELDTEATEQTPEDDAKYGSGKGWGGMFRVKPTEDGYEIRNSEKGGLVAIIDAMGNFKMLSADESRAEMDRAKGEETDYMERRREMSDYMEESKEEKKSNKMKKSELKEMIKAAMLNEASEFDINKPARIEAFLKSLDDLIEEYHAELYLNDDLFAAIEDVKSAAKSEMGGPVGDIPGFEGTMDALDSLSIREEKKDKEEEDVEDEEVDIDIDQDEEDMDMDMDMGDMDMEDGGEVGLTGDKKVVDDSLEAALEAARALGDEKLVDQIGNTITFFTRSQIVKETISKEEMLQETKRMQRIAGIIK